MTFSLAGADRVALVGDSHANYLWMHRVLTVLAGQGVKDVIVLGDFGYWPELAAGREFVDGVALRVQQLEMNFAFLDGNHEDHAALGTGSLEPPPSSAREIVPGIYHLHRGARFQFGAHTVVACGGAVSVDQKRRVAGVDWFAEEAVDDATIARIIAQGPADLLLTHDAPLGARCFVSTGEVGRLETPPKHPDVSESICLDVSMHQRRILTLLEGVEASTLVHGHHHVRYSEILSTRVGEARIEGIGRDGTWPGEGFIVVDTSLRIMQQEDLG